MSLIVLIRPRCGACAGLAAVALETNQDQGGGEARWWEIFGCGERSGGALSTFACPSNRQLPDFGVPAGCTPKFRLERLASESTLTTTIVWQPARSHRIHSHADLVSPRSLFGKQIDSPKLLLILDVDAPEQSALSISHLLPTCLAPHPTALCADQPPTCR